MEYAHKADILIIGRKYLVAHARIIRKLSDSFWGDVPIIPILHKDEAFAPGIDEHYHLDMRFGMPQYIKWRFAVNNSKSRMPVLKEDNYGYMISEIVFIEKKCLRLNTGLNIPEDKERTKRYDLWYKSMLGKSCAGKRCPHYGAIMIEDKGKIYCPMHNLHADLITLKVVNPY